jgi:hypothetical protein
MRHGQARSYLQAMPRILALAACPFTVLLIMLSTAANAKEPDPLPPLPPPPGNYTVYRQTQETFVPQTVAPSGPSPSGPSPSGPSPSGPREITEWTEGDPVPTGYHLARRTRKGFIIGGAVTFASLYLLSAFSAATLDDAGEGPAQALYIPAIGPFIQMFYTTTERGKLLDALDGVAQTGALVMLVVGLTSPRTIPVRDLATPSVLPVPYVSESGGGLRVVGSF